MIKDVVKNNKSFLYLFLLFLTVLFMSIGYASISSTPLDIVGNVAADSQSGVIITDVVYNSSLSNTNEESSVKGFLNTTLHSNINLSKSDITSSVTYDITVYNNTHDTYGFNKVIYDDAFYNNPAIGFEITGIKNMDKIEPKKELTFSVTFKYLNNELSGSNNLDSYLNFSFKKVFSISYLNFDQDDYQKEILDGEKLEVDFGDYSPIVIDVTMNNTLLDEDIDFTYENEVLTVPIINGDTIIDNKDVLLSNNSIYCWDKTIFVDDYIDVIIDRVKRLHVKDMYVEFSDLEQYSGIIATLRENGLNVYSLSGSTSWYKDVDKIKTHIDAVYNYNINNPNNQLSGLILDIEPYSNSEYKADVITGFQTFANTMEESYSYAQSKNVKIGLSIPYWYDNYFTKDEYTAEQKEIGLNSFKKLIANVDRVSVMNYYKSKTINHIETEIQYARQYNKEIESIAEFSRTSSSITDKLTFYTENYPVKSANKNWHKVRSSYDYDKLEFSYHNLNIILEIYNNLRRHKFEFVDLEGNTLTSGQYTVTFDDGSSVEKRLSSDVYVKNSQQFTVKLKNYVIVQMLSETELENGIIKRVYQVEPIVKYQVELYAKYFDNTKVINGTVKLINTIDGEEHIGTYNEAGQYFYFKKILSDTPYRLVYINENNQEYSLNTATAKDDNALESTISDSSGNIIIPTHHKANQYVVIKSVLNRAVNDIEYQRYILEIYPKLWNGTRYSSIKSGKVKLVNDNGEEFIGDITGTSSGYYTYIQAVSNTPYHAYILDAEGNDLNYTMDSYKYEDISNEEFVVSNPNGVINLPNDLGEYVHVGINFNQ